MALIVCLLIAACDRGPVPLVEYRNESIGVALRHPRGWTVLTAPDADWVQIVPPQGSGAQPDPLRYSEFVSIRMVRGVRSADEDRMRGIAFSELPFHGVAKFQREAVSGGEARYRFEGTGTSAIGQWASVGVLIVGRERALHVVCAKPIERWRDGQRECDDVIASVEVSGR
ncbi:MAG: hypothetical protein QN163_01060 [Armatimonadota bacterium]|nr:hypothetical protein [Armatimonadota bacterium]MDR5697652.1 hypothetical protein [Armatimonadota bacterium]